MALLDGVGHDPAKLGEAWEYKKPPFWLAAAKNSGLVLFFSVFIFFCVNLPAYALIGGYRINPERFAKDSPEAEEAVVVPREEWLKHEEIKLAKATPTPRPSWRTLWLRPRALPSPSPVPKAPAKAEETKYYPDGTLFVPRIAVEAPVSWDAGEDEVMKVLADGLAHIVGTGRPGEEKNIFITGHSSNYWWNEGDYKTVFALLGELGEGDEIFITYQGKFHKYKVFETKEVSKKEVGDFVVFDEEKLTLMTCVPVGTNLRRLLVFAEPV